MQGYPCPLSLHAMTIILPGIRLLPLGHVNDHKKAVVTVAKRLLTAVLFSQHSLHWRKIISLTPGRRYYAGR